MARTALTVTEIVRAGVAQPAQQNSDATNDHYVASTDADDCWFIEAYNSSGTTRTITVVANPSLSSDGLTVSDYTNTILTTATELMGPFKLGTFKQTADSNKVYVNVDGADSDVKFRVYKITPVS
jgi:hypothetical protein